MAQFYKELKELRISKEISLEDLESKTKINIKYLKAIEEGDFNVLPSPYLRLFIRAYAIEIGGEADRALDQLDSFVGNTKPSMSASIKKTDKEDDEIFEISKNSIIREKIKKINIIENNIEFTVSDEILNSFIKSIFSPKEIYNLDDYKNYVNSLDISFDLMKEKLIMKP